MSYEPMKPLKPEYHEVIAEWVRKGGRLVYIGDDSDPFHTAREWWNSDGKTSATARQHLFEKLNVPSSVKDGGSWREGAGWVTWHRQHPAKLAIDGQGPEKVLRLASGADTGNETSLLSSPHIRLQRGPYVVGAVIHESTIEQPMHLDGYWLDLFSSGALVLEDPVIQPGRVFLLRSLNEPPSENHATVIASSARVEQTTVTENAAEFILRGPSAITEHQVILRAKTRPARVEANGAKLTTWEWDEQKSMVRVKIPWRENGMTLKVSQ